MGTKTIAERIIERAGCGEAIDSTGDINKAPYPYVRVRTISVDVDVFMREDGIVLRLDRPGLPGLWVQGLLCAMEAEQIADVLKAAADIRLSMRRDAYGMAAARDVAKERSDG